jgi:uncharacterized protein YecE (DUF72 family)
MKRIHIGTSGFSYPYWKGKFYPEKLPASRWLEYYSTQFNCLEINNSFYKFPVLKHLKRAADITPADFVFSVKMHRVVTHYRRMKQVREKIAAFMEIAEEGLGKKLSCILFQLPPAYRFTEERLDDILQSLDPDPRNAIEFRHASWWTPTVFRALRKHHLTFCSTSYPGLPGEPVTTSSIFYKRMHGIPKLFQSAYSHTELDKLADELPARKQVFVFFNNTTYEAGYTNALELKNRIGQSRHGTVLAASSL